MKGCPYRRPLPENTTCVGDFCCTRIAGESRQVSIYECARCSTGGEMTVTLTNPDDCLRTREPSNRKERRLAKRGKFNKYW